MRFAQSRRKLPRTAGLRCMRRHFWMAADPLLPDAIAAVASRGADDVVVVPYFLTLGLHLQRDLPELVDIARLKFPGLSIRVAPPLDGHPSLSAILVDRAREAPAR